MPFRLLVTFGSWSGAALMSLLKPFSTCKSRDPKLISRYLLLNLEFMRSRTRTTLVRGSDYTFPKFSTLLPFMAGMPTDLQHGQAYRASHTITSILVDLIPNSL